MHHRSTASLSSSALTRRRLMRRGGLGSLALLAGAAPAWPWPQSEDETPLPFLDPDPDPGKKMVRWEKLTSWQTPIGDFFTVQHYGVPETGASQWKVQVRGMVRTERDFSLEEIQQLSARNHMAAMECAGNGAFPKFRGAIGNAQWRGAPLEDLLRQVAVDRRAVEVVFYGADQKVETIREKEYPQHFARSLSLKDATDPQTLLIWEMNGKPLPKEHGGPLRLGVLGHYGVAWVKWLQRIEVIDRRFSGRFMARDYVTIRGEPLKGENILWRETTVSRVQLKSIVARAVRRSNGDVRFYGAVWNDGRTPLKAVEVRIDNGDWQTAHLGEGLGSRYSWVFWDFDWRKPAPGEHTVTSRALDLAGRVQPSPDDPQIRLKHTYWEANQQVTRRFRV